MKRLRKDFDGAPKISRQGKRTGKPPVVGVFVTRGSYNKENWRDSRKFVEKTKKVG
jgi:hypothetical protein